MVVKAAEQWRTLAAAAISTVAAGMTMAAQINFLQNSDFAGLDAANDALHWSLSGRTPAFERPPPAADAPHEPAVIIKVPGGGSSVLSQKVATSANTTCFLRLPLRTSARAEVVAGGRLLGYTGEGEWQTIADLVKTDLSGNITVTLRLHASPDETESLFELGQIRLSPADPPVTPPRRFAGRAAPSLKDFAADAFIIHPVGRDDYSRLAGQIQATIAGKTGISIPVVSDTEATLETPVLHPAYRAAHLIILGRLGINRALWPVYNRFLCAVDGYYPGGDGYVVRTAANVMRNGRNHIILGGSSDAGAARAAERFCEITEGLSDPSQPLPWLLEVELQGDCRTAFDAADTLWTETPDSPLLPEPSPGYRTIIRWYMNAMGYYWTGGETWRQRSLQEFEEVLKDRAYTHHYIVEFFIRTYDMLDDSGLFTPQQIASADSLILKNFYEFLTGPDLGWMTLFRPPYESISVRNRHSIAPWISDLMMADFLHDYFDLQGDLAEIVAYRRAEKHPFFRHLAAERWQPSLPNLNEAHDDEITATFFRYALHNERYEFFTSDNARRALKSESLTAARSRNADDHLLLGILASYYSDGRYKNLLETLPHTTRIFQNRYLCGVHRYRPGPEVESRTPSGMTGVLVPPLQPHDAIRLQNMAFATHRNPDVKTSEFFEQVVMRSGFSPASDMLSVSGFGHNTGAITAFSCLGQSILKPVERSSYGPLPAIYHNMNALSVIRTDRWLGDPKPYAGAARLDWHLDDRPSGGGAGFTVEPFMTTAWQRQILWLDNGLFVIHDSVTALEDGRYWLGIGWFANGAPQWEDHSWQGRLPGVKYRMTPLGGDFSRNEKLPQSQRLVLERNLKKGETVRATMLIEAVDPASNFSSSELADGNSLHIYREQNDSAPAIIRINWDYDQSVAPQVVRVSSGDSSLLPDREHPAPADLRSAGKDSHKPQNEPAQVSDEGKWRASWRYAGLQQPALIKNGRNLSGDIFDLGREYRLAEIRSPFSGGGAWRPAPMPQIETSPDIAEPEWSPLPGEPRWRAGIKTGNYGEAVPVQEAFQTYRPPAELKARFIRGQGAGLLLYFDADTLEARSPLDLETADLDGNGKQDIVVVPDLWPPFLRNRTREDTAIAVLRVDGSERFQKTFEQNIQQVRPLQPGLNKPAGLFVLTQDARLSILNGDGQLQREDDLHAMHEEFNRVSGRPNTRQPAGGFTLPFSVGQWRPDAGGLYGTVVARYGAYSFLDAAGKFEGLLTAGDYVLARLLPYGVDFDGDGREEQLCLGKWGITRIDGENTPYIPEPDGARFFPQVYRASVYPGKGGRGTVDGTRIHLFEAVPFSSPSEKPRLALAVRESVVALYDPLNGKAVFHWLPPVSILSAALIQSTPQLLSLVVGTEENLLWKLEWRNGITAAPDVFNAAALPGNALALAASGSGGVWIATGSGLYHMDSDSRLALVNGGAWQSVCSLPAHPASAVAITDKGEVIRFDKE